MTESIVQILVFVGVTAAIAFATYIHCRGKGHRQTNQNKEYFLAGGGLAWYFVAGSITLTNLSTDQLVGMNGNQIEKDKSEFVSPQVAKRKALG